MKTETSWELTKGRANNFDFLRFFFAALVIFSHSFPLLYGPNGNIGEPFSLVTHAQVTGGSLAVSGFFILSGFLITHSWLSSTGVISFLRKRLLRIYPGFIVVSLICTFIVGPLGSTDLLRYIKELDLPRSILHMFLLWEPDGTAVFANNAFPHAINGSLWTIKYEVFCYLLVALLGILGVYRQKRLVLLLLCLVLIARAVQIYNLAAVFPDRELYLWHLPIGNPRLWPGFLSYFLAGMAFYLYRARIPYSRNLLIISVLIVAGCAFSLKGLHLALPIFGTYILFFTGFNPSLKVQNFARRGDLSYGVYLYAFPVQQLLVFFGGRYLTPFTLFLAALPLSCLLAFLSWHFVEQPFLRLKKKPLDRAGQEMGPREMQVVTPTQSQY